VIRNLLLSGGPVHDFDATSATIAAVLATADGGGDGDGDGDGDGVTIDTTIVTEPADALAHLRAAAVDLTQRWNLLTVNALRWRMEADRYADQRDAFAFTLAPDDGELIETFVRGGGGLLALHTAVICFDAEAHWHALTGASWNWDRSSHPPVGEVDVEVTDAGRRHPITVGIDPFRIVDEVYGGLDEADDFEPLLTTTRDGRAHPLLWARTVGDGHVVTDLLGHGVESVGHPTHRTILRRAAAWTTGSRA